MAGMVNMGEMPGHNSHLAIRTFIANQLIIVLLLVTESFSLSQHPIVPSSQHPIVPSFPSSHRSHRPISSKISRSLDTQVILGHESLRNLRFCIVGRLNFVEGTANWEQLEKREIIRRSAAHQPHCSRPFPFSISRPPFQLFFRSNDRYIFPYTYIWMNIQQNP
jgi:hypothetical protein